MFELTNKSLNNVFLNGEINVSELVPLESGTNISCASFRENERIFPRC